MRRQLLAFPPETFEFMSTFSVLYFHVFLCETDIELIFQTLSLAVTLEIVLLSWYMAFSCSWFAVPLEISWGSCRRKAEGLGGYLLSLYRSCSHSSLL